MPLKQVLRTVLVCAMFVVGIPPLAASEAHSFSEFNHMSWTGREGAPSGISSLIQTKDRYLWMGTPLGLYRYDGLRFASYPFTPADPPLPSSDISALAADPSGGLWVGYRLGGITRLKDGRAIHYGQKNGLLGNSTSQLLCQQDGSVWAIADGHLMHLNGERWENFGAQHGLSSNGLFTVFFDKSGNIWSAAKFNVFLLRKGAEHFEILAATTFAVTQFAQAPDGTIWVSDGWKSVRPLLPSEKAQPIQLPGTAIILLDSDGMFWIAQDYRGVARVRANISTKRDPASIESFTASDGLTSKETRAILKDDEGNIWVGTARGLDRFQRSSFTRFHYRTVESFPSLAAATDGTVWVGLWGSPLLALRNGQVTPGVTVHGAGAIFCDRNDSLWLLDYWARSLFRYGHGRPQKISFPQSTPDAQPQSVGEDPHGFPLVSFEGDGLWRYANGWERVNVPGFSAEAPLSIMTESPGRVWLGYSRSRIVLLEADGVHPYNLKDGADIGSILTLHAHEGQIFAGGSNGVASFDGSQFRRISLARKEALRGVSGIIFDKLGGLWMNGGTGVVHVTASEVKRGLASRTYAMESETFDDRYGLMGFPAQVRPTPSAVADANGTLWFATAGNLVSVDPRTLRFRVNPPTTYIQAVLVNGTTFLSQSESTSDRAENITRSSQLKNLEFDYVGLDFTSPERVVYRYKLDGEDKDWQDAGDRRQALYNKLAPGEYLFRVIASNGNGVWSEAATTRIKISPAFYQTSWFYLLCFALLVAALWVCYLLRLQYVTGRMQERMEARANERVRIARELHDTLLQSLHGLMLRFHFAVEALPEREPAREMLQGSLKRADLAIVEARERVQDLRNESAASRSLPEAIESVARELRVDDSVNFSILVEGHPRDFHPPVKEELCRIAHEALTNSFHHSKASRIEVGLDYSFARFRMQCRDNGSGIEPSVLKDGGRDGHWGLVGMKERASAIGATLEVWSSPGSGTEIGVTLPAPKAYAAAFRKGFWSRLLSDRRSLEE